MARTCASAHKGNFGLVTRREICYAFYMAHNRSNDTPEAIEAAYGPPLVEDSTPGPLYYTDAIGSDFDSAEYQRESDLN